MTSTPLRADAARNRARMLATAETVFARLGTGTSVEDVARAAGVGPATVYRHFPRKDDLISAVLRGYFERLLRQADDAVRATDERCIPVFLVTVGRDLATAGGLAHGLWGDLAPRDLVAELEQLTATLVERARTAGAIAPTITVDDIATTVRALRAVIDDGQTDWLRHVAIMVAGLKQGPDTTTLES